MSIEILSAGPMLTVQDTGRKGLRHLGVSSAGAIDPDAMTLANALCGNPADAATLEFAGPGGQFRAGRALRFAVTGAECDIRIGTRPVPPGESHRLVPGDTLTIGSPRNGVWAYLAVSGGIAIDPILHSRATHLRSGLGGVEGRPLKAGDRLPLGPETDGPCLLLACPLARAPKREEEPQPIRVILGPQSDRFTESVLVRFTSAHFTVTPRRDRMAMVLGDVELRAAGGHDILSDGTVPGSIQVPGSGTPLILLAESQTTGGYPKIATVTSVDLPRLAQLPVGSKVRFVAISRDEGEDLWLASRRAFHAKLAGLVRKSEGVLSSDYLLSCDLVGGIAAPDEIAGTDQPPRGAPR